MTLAELVGERYSLNHLSRSVVKAPKKLHDEAEVKVTLYFESEGFKKGSFTIKIPLKLSEKEKKYEKTNT